MTVTDVSTTSAVVIFSVNVSCMKGHFSWYKLLFGQGKGRIPSGCHGNLETVTFMPCAPQPVNKKKRMGRVVMVYLLNNKRIYFLCLFEAVYCNPQPTLTREVTCFHSTKSDSTYYTIRISHNIKRLKQSKEAVEHMHSVDHNEICATLNWVRKTDELVVLILKLRISKTTKIKHSKLKIL